MEDRELPASQSGRQTSNPTSEEAHSGAAAQRNDAPHYSTKDLFGVRSEIVIEHEGSAYRLKITRHGKLILNK
ncbi:MAG: hemin uptake protein HemP [Pseudomonadota bacterium]